MKLLKSPRAITERSSNNHKEEENFSMKKIYLIFAIILVAVLTLTLSGCGRDEISLDGLYVTTFELEGGVLETPTSSVSTKINFAYHPGTYVLDPCALNGYTLTRMGYDFTGWYTDKSCTPASKWDFGTPLNSEKLTLYAGWKVSVQLTFNVCYVDENGATVSLGKYDASTNPKFEDWRNYAKGRANHTPVGYYSDPECTILWDDSFRHPGGEEDLDVPVYVGYIKGVWTFVDTFSEFQSALISGQNIYLTADIDANGESLSFGDYSGELNGNGFTVSNFTVAKKGTAIVSCAIFNTLGDGAVIKDVSFTGVTYDISNVISNVNKMKVAALAVKAGNVTVSGVSIEGSITTNYSGELLDSDVQMFFETTDGASVEINESNVSVDINTVN